MTPDQIIAWIISIGKSIKRLFKKPRCLLIIDDNADDVEMLALHLRKTQIFDRADDAETALWMLRQKNYSIVFLDMRLPRMDGWTLLKKILDEFPSAHIVVSLGHIEDLKNIPSGVYVGVIVKPPTARAIKDVLSKTKM